MLEELLAQLAPDWETDGYGDSSLLICPCGDMFEQDRTTPCDEGHVNPLLGIGVI